jgi:hypothetical protein
VANCTSNLRSYTLRCVGALSVSLFANHRNKRLFSFG